MERKVHFNQLSAELRQRLIDCFKGQSAPAPILEERLSVTGAIVGLVFLSLAGLGALSFVMWVDFGRLYSGVQSPLWLLGYGLALWMVFYGVVKATQRLLLAKTLPFAPGRYLFPLEIVDARSSVLRILPMGALTDFRAVHHHTNGAYTHTELHFYFEGGVHEMFSVRGKELAEQTLDRFDAQRALFREALEAGDMGIVAALDPFLEVRLEEDGWARMTASPVTVSEGPSASDLILPMMYPSLVALVMGMLLAGPLWGGRQVMSDEARFKRAMSASVTSAYGSRADELETYLRYGGFRHREAAQTVELPKARYEAAKAQGTVTALRELLSAHPSSPHRQEALAQISALFDAALKKVQSKSAQENPEAAAFMARLLKHLEREGLPTMEVRFRAPPTQHLSRIDAELSKEFGPSADPKRKKRDPITSRVVAPIAPEFSDARSAPREEAITQSLRRAFEAIIPRDILTLEHGPRLPEDAQGADAQGGDHGEQAGEAVKAVKQLRFPRPTIVVDYIVLPSTALYTLDKNPGKVFVGIEIVFSVTMHLPEDEQVLSLTLKVEPPQNFSVSYSSELGLVAGPSDSQVYHVMAIRAFDQLASKLRDYFKL